MAQIINKKNLSPGVVPSLGELALGELAINTFDGKLYTKRDQGGIHTIVEIGNDGPDATGLKSVDQGNGIGWTLQCRIDNPDHYGNLGHGAVDFSASESSEETGATGRFSFAVGYSTTAYGTDSFAEGSYTTAAGNGSHAEGNGTLASGNYSHAEGFRTTASKNYSHASGVLAEASGYASFAHGKYVVASGENQVVIGTYNFPRIDSSFLIGNGYGGGSGGDENSNAFEVYINGRVIAPSLTSNLINSNPRSLVTKEYVDTLGGNLINIDHGYGIPEAVHAYKTTVGNHAVDFSWIDGYDSQSGASGYASFAIGYNTLSSGSYSMASGHADSYLTPVTASGFASHAEGQDTIASGRAAHAEGNSSQAEGDSSHAEGQGTRAYGSSCHTEGMSTHATGTSSHAEGFATRLYGDYSHTEGYKTGVGSEVDPRKGAHSEGYRTYALANYAHTEGSWCYAAGIGAHSEGQNANAGGNYAHAEGRYTLANADNSHAEGYRTTTQNQYMHVQGTWNIGSAGDTIHEVGIGTGLNDKKNAFEIYTDGRIRAPELTENRIDHDKSLVTREYLANNAGGADSELEKITEDDQTGWRLLGADIVNHGNIGDKAIDLSHQQYQSFNNKNGATGFYSFATGRTTDASGHGSVALGDTTAATNRGAFSAGNNTRATGECSVALGDNTTASGSYSVSVGYETDATGSKGSLAEGYYTTASGESSHAEGKRTIAAGVRSHAQGLGSEANGPNSHAEGEGTLAKNSNSHAAGIYNTGLSDETIHETGMGIDYQNRKNAFEIYTNGRIIAPELTAGLIANDEQTLTTRKYVDDAVSGVSIHTHDNKTVIDGISEADVGGTMVLVYNGNAVDHVVAQRDVYDDLDSIDPTISLSANQGRILNNRITETVNDIALQDQDFDGTVGDNEFIITGEVLQGAFVYKEGLKLRSNQFSVTNDGTDTIITLMQALNSNAWIAVEFTR